MKNTNNNPQYNKRIEQYIFNTNAVLGKGTSGTVYEGTCTKTGKQVAVKVINQSVLKDEYTQQLMIQEITTMKQINHPNLVRLYDVFQTQNSIYLITELCRGGDLQVLLSKRGANHLNRNFANQQRQKTLNLSEEEAMTIFKDIVSGVKELFKRGILHRDLKLANVLKDGNTYKITDFGFSRNIEHENQLMKSCVGTPYYMSPQLLLKNSYSSKCEVWSLGVILYEIIYGETPWPANNYVDLVTNVTSLPLSFNVKPGRKVSQQAQILIQKCLQKNEQDRLSLEDLISLPYLFPEENDALNINNHGKSQKKKKFDSYVKQKQKSKGEIFSATNLNPSPLKINYPKPQAKRFLSPGQNNKKQTNNNNDDNNKNKNNKVYAFTTEKSKEQQQLMRLNTSPPETIEEQQQQPIQVQDFNPHQQQAGTPTTQPTLTKFNSENVVRTHTVPDLQKFTKKGSLEQYLLLQQQQQGPGQNVVHNEIQETVTTQNDQQQQYDDDVDEDSFDEDQSISLQKYYQSLMKNYLSAEFQVNKTVYDKQIQTLTNLLNLFGNISKYSLQSQQQLAQKQKENQQQGKTGGAKLVKIQFIILKYCVFIIDDLKNPTQNLKLQEINGFKQSYEYKHLKQVISQFNADVLTKFSEIKKQIEKSEQDNDNSQSSTPRTKAEEQDKSDFQTLFKTQDKYTFLTNCRMCLKAYVDQAWKQLKDKSPNNDINQLIIPAGVTNCLNGITDLYNSIAKHIYPKEQNQQQQQNQPTEQQQQQKQQVNYQLAEQQQQYQYQQQQPQYVTPNIFINNQNIVNNNINNNIYNNNLTNNNIYNHTVNNYMADIRNKEYAKNTTDRTKDSSQSSKGYITNINDNKLMTMSEVSEIMYQPLDNQENSFQEHVKIQTKQRNSVYVNNNVHVNTEY